MSGFARRSQLLNYREFSLVPCDTDTDMPDLFFSPDDRWLRSRWDRTLALFRIVARDYCFVLRGLREQDHHRAILLQAAADLIGLDRDFRRRGIASPAKEFGETEQLVWDAVVPLIVELERWHVPGPWVSTEEIETALRDRKVFEERLNAILLDTWADYPAERPARPAVVDFLKPL
jgi:hypothetical protein